MLLHGSTLVPELMLQAVAEGSLHCKSAIRQPTAPLLPYPSSITLSHLFLQVSSGAGEGCSINPNVDQTSNPTTLFPAPCIHIRPCRFPVVLAPVDARDGGEVHPLVCVTVVSQPGQARVHTYYPFISFRMARDLQVCGTTSS